MKNYKITVNGNVYDVTVEEGVAQAASTPMVSSIPTQIKSQESQVKQVSTTAPVSSTTKPTVALGTQGTVKINSPMPGKILNINVSIGQNVKKGQALVVLEAMKMENEIVAPEDGTVISINVSVGGSVESGDLLVSLN